MRILRAGAPVAENALLVLALVAVLTFQWIPWLMWLLPFIFGAVVVSGEVAGWPTQVRRQALATTVVLLAIHGVLAVIRSASYTAAVDTLWNDDFLFYTQSVNLAEAWRDGVYLDITERGDPPYMGTLHVGYQRALGFLFTLAGASTLLGLLLNAVCSSLLPILVGATADHVFGSSLADQKQQTKLLSAALLLTAFHPAQFYWNAFLLKDVFLTLLFISTLLLALRFLKYRDLVSFVGLILSLAFLYYVRAYAAFSILIGMAGWLALFASRKWAAIGCGLLILLLFMIVNYTEKGSYQFGRLWGSIMFLAPDASTTSTQMVAQIFKSIPRFVLTPYGWLKVSVKEPLYGLYPGSWYLYVVVYPLAAAGFWRALRTNNKIASVPVLCFWASAFILIMSNYEGNASRQRYYLEYLVIIFASAGVIWRNRVAMAVVVALITAFAAGQIYLLSGRM